MKNLPNSSLGNEFFNLQVKYGFPGLISECQNLIKLYNLDNILDEKINLSKQEWSRKVNDAVLAKSQELIKKEFLTYSKLKDHDNDEVLELKDYTINMNLRDARTMFRLRSHMINVKMNQKSVKRYANEL